MTTEEKRLNEQTPALDPGSLMVAMYILGVTALVLLGWFGAAGAGGREQTAVRSVIEQTGY